MAIKQAAITAIIHIENTLILTTYIHAYYVVDNHAALSEEIVISQTYQLGECFVCTHRLISIIQERKQSPFNRNFHLDTTSSRGILIKGKTKFLPSVTLKEHCLFSRHDSPRQKRT
jgi:hypothetical protein